jgi:hypothetical protein
MREEFRLSLPPPKPVPRGKLRPAEQADDGSRTRDLELGKLALYQLSYVRVWRILGASLPSQG